MRAVGARDVEASDHLRHEIQVLRKEGRIRREEWTKRGRTWIIIQKGGRGAVM